MRLNDKYSLREVAGEKVIIQQGRSGVDMTKIISLNPSAEFLWTHFLGQSFTQEDVAASLVEEYSIDPALASADAQKWIAQMRELSLVID